jgi:hypothetical protein
MTQPFIRKDMIPLANELGCAPVHLVRVPDDIWAEFDIYAKRTHCKTETAIVAALSAWLGRT